MNTIIKEIRERIEARKKNTYHAGDYDKYADGIVVGLSYALGIIDKVEKEHPVPSDVQEAANQYIGYPPEVDEGVSTSRRRQAFADGMLAERWRVNRKAEVTEDYDPKYDKEALEAADEYVNGALTYGAFRLMRPAFADGWMAHKERLMKDAVEIDADITINRYTKQHILHISSTDEHIQHLPQGEYKVIIIKKEK